MQRITEYKGLLGSVSALLEKGRRSTAKSVNAVLTADFWLVGQGIIEYEQVDLGQTARPKGDQLLCPFCLLREHDALTGIQQHCVRA